MLHIDEIVVVEGKYDKEKLKKVTDAPVVCTYGFELYRSDRIIRNIKKLAKNRGVIVLTDSDRAGFRIRNYLKQCLSESVEIKNAYIPQIEGKEKRKEKPGADGILGVEAMSEKLLEEILFKASASSCKEKKCVREVTKSEFYADGFSGKTDSAERRKKLAKLMNLPNMSANALLDIINKIYGYDEYKQYVEKL